MMNHLRWLLLACLYCCCLSRAQAQAGSVLLKNPSGTLAGTYASISAAYNAIPEPLTGSYTIAVDTAYHGTAEPHPILLQGKAGAGSTSQIRIVLNPTASCTGLSISGNVTTAPVLVLDGARWVTIDGDRCGGLPQGFGFFGDVPPNNAPNHPTIVFRHGASNNTIRNCFFYGSPSGGQTPPLILMDTAAAGGTGNNNNRIADCYFGFADRIFRSAGSAAAPNTGNHFSNNTAESCYSTVAEVGGGTAAMFIDSNNVLISGSQYSRTFTAIRLTHLQDTLRIRNNSIHFYYGLAYDSITGIGLSPAIAQPGSYGILTNNYLGYARQYGQDYIHYNADSIEAITGIAVDAQVPFAAAILYNTVRLDHDVDTTARRVLYSTAFRYSGSAGARVRVRVRNNLFLNHRTGGSNGSMHPAADIADTAGLLTGYNGYNTVSAALLRVQGIAYNSFAAYQAAYPGMDAASNDTPVRYDGLDAEQLSPFMYNNPGMQGQPEALVPADRYGRARTYPYRGADELTPNCANGAFYAYVYAQPDSACASTGLLLSYLPQNSAGGIVHQWQVRPAGATAFTDVPGATGREYQTVQTAATDYRVKDSCIAGGLVVYTLPVRVGMRTAPRGTLSAAPAGIRNYSFTAENRGGSRTAATWYFGDGDSLQTTADQVTHAYNAEGAYQVMVVTRYDCAPSDTLTIMVYVVDEGIETAGKQAGLRLFPNPAGNTLQIEAEGVMQEVALMDMSGRVLLQQPVNSSRYVLATAGQPAGVYLVRVLTVAGPLCRQIRIAH